jgi:hypothetical protein
LFIRRREHDSAVFDADELGLDPEEDEDRCGDCGEVWSECECDDIEEE